MKRPCLDCGIATARTRCDQCWTQEKARRAANTPPRPRRPHYDRTYEKQAAKIRRNATACWICGEGARANDPFQADHVIPRNTAGGLLPAHRSCNIRRAHQLAAEQKRRERKNHVMQRIGRSGVV